MNLPVVKSRMEIAELNDPDTAAQMVLYMGVSDLPSPPSIKFDLDSEGNPINVDSELQYIGGVWPDLSRRDQGKAVELGLQRAANMREGLNDGIQLVVWKAYDKGWWTATDMNGGDERAFRAWVKEVIVPEGASPTEATQLASTILNLVWLDDNGYAVGDDLDYIFSNRALYNRWRRIASPLRQAISNIVNSQDDGTYEDASEQISEMINAVNDPDKTIDDLDAIRSNPRLPEAIFVIEDRDQIGRSIVSATLTDAQLNHLRIKTRGSARFVLEGEQRDDGEMVLVEYRVNVSPETGEILMSRREWSTDIWTPWFTVDEMNQGIPEGAPLVDESLHLEYHRQWEAA